MLSFRFRKPGKMPNFLSHFVLETRTGSVPQSSTSPAKDYPITEFFSILDYSLCQSKQRQNKDSGLGIRGLHILENKHN